MQTVTTIGLDIAKSVSRFTALMLMARWLSAAVEAPLRFADRVDRRAVSVLSAFL